MPTCIIPTIATEHIARKLKGKKDLEVVFTDKNKEGKRYFPDGEVYVRLSRVDELKERVVLLHSGAPKSNDGLVETEMLLQILNTKEIPLKEIFFTYFPYGQQDKVFEIGEANVAENLIKKFTEYYNIDKIYIIDAHFFGREWAEKYPIVNVSAVDLLIKETLKDYPDIVFVAPDKGSQRRTGLKGIEKTRKNSYIVDISSSEELKSTVSGKIVGVVDDIIETGGTMIRFYDECMDYGAKEVVALITHGLLQEGIERIQRKYSKLYLTNTINRKEANVDVAGLILGTIRRYNKP